MVVLLFLSLSVHKAEMMAQWVLKCFNYAQFSVAAFRHASEMDFLHHLKDVWNLGFKKTNPENKGF